MTGKRDVLHTAPSHHDLGWLSTVATLSAGHPPSPLAGRSPGSVPWGRHSDVPPGAGGGRPASGNHHYAWGTAFSYDETNDPEDAGWAIGNRGLRQDGNGAWGGGGHIPGKLSLTATPK